MLEFACMALVFWVFLVLFMCARGVYLIYSRTAVGRKEMKEMWILLQEIFFWSKPKC